MSSERTLKNLVGERGFEPPTPWSRTSPLRLTNFAKEINRLPSGDLASIMPHMGSCDHEKLFRRKPHPTETQDQVGESIN